MGPRKWTSCLAGSLLLVLAGCSTADDAAETTGGAAETTGGAAETPGTDPVGSIELGVSETCLADSDPQCIPVGDQYVVEPQEFVSAGVADARAGTQGDGQEVLDVAFDDGGASVLQSTTAEVAQDGPDARLVMKVGDSVLSAVAVPAPVEGDQMQIALPRDVHARELIEMIEAA